MTDKDVLLREALRFLREYLHGCDDDGLIDEDCEWCRLSARITAALEDDDKPHVLDNWHPPLPKGDRHD